MPEKNNEIFSYTEKGKRKEKKELKKEMRKASGKRPVWKNILLCFLIVIFLAAGIGMIYYYQILGNIGFRAINEKNNYSNSKSNISSDIKKDGEQSLDLFDGTLLNDPMILNILIFGEDSGAGSDTQYGRSDTMIMVSIDNRHKQVKMTSFMRDMLVNIPYYDSAGNEYGMDKLNAAYRLGGAELAVQTLEANFGVDIDRYAIVNFKSFKSIIDALNGIDIKLTQDEIDYINWQTYINNQSTERYEIKDSPGLVHLNGRQALWYARDRGYQEDEHPEFVISGNDFDRTSRQRNLMRTLMNRFKNANFTEIVKVVAEIGPMLTTNLKKDEITTLVANSPTYLSYSISEFRLPTGDCYKYSWFKKTPDALAQSVLEITDIQGLRTQLAKFVFGEEAVVKNNSEIETDPPTETPTYTGFSDTSGVSEAMNATEEETD